MPFLLWIEYLKSHSFGFSDSAYVWELLFCSAGGHSKGNENSPNIFTLSDAHWSVSSDSDALLHLLDGENLTAGSKHDVMSSQLSSNVIDL